MRRQKAERSTQKPATAAAAFTLVELMVAIALVLVLMVGVSKVFKITTDTVSANQGISEHTRDARAAQSVLAQDFNSAVTSEAPFLIIHNQVQAAFRNRADMNGDRDYNPAATAAPRDDATRSIDIDGNNQEGTGLGEFIRPANYNNNRNHRLDIISFFARGLFRRQTGGIPPNGSTPFVSDMTSPEAWIWYGHLRIANNAGSFTVNQDPGAGTLGNNSNNFFASDWILGRQAILLREPDATTGNITDENGQNQLFITSPAAGGLTPLSFGTGDNDSSGTFEIQNSRWDLAGTSIQAYRSKILTYIQANPNATWWNNLFGGGGTRFQVNPIIQKPITPATLSQQAPLFIRGCTSFIVEFAGDFISQDNDPNATTWGQMTNTYFQPTGSTDAPATDGIIDYVLDWNDANNNGLIDAGERASVKKRIRWYGMPRDVDGNGSIRAWSAARTNNLLPDVVPLRDVLRSGSASTSASMPASLKSVLATCDGAPFEKQLAAPGSKLPVATGTNNQVSPPVAGDYLANTNGMTRDAEYNCAWSADDLLTGHGPKMVRLTITLDDPTGRTADGQTFEYVFELP